ncbi:LuxR family transcriptional regulator [Burkholderia gladioli]|uniref:LuxR family transcriptional regulator n=1 Tax=Burkholderia gladioli TaxID=28095 RepID=UPI0022D703B7|nr:LuxR family transcriptional regulator [Burkholderia gladioli]MDA0574068.1 LuxR family transcriptional regulator [Burkholderia gladioli]MDA0602363.1 LuxR family transcriptional regulator [Burkholderia gladioli]
MRNLIDYACEETHASSLSSLASNFVGLRRAKSMSDIFNILAAITRRLDFDVCSYRVRGKSVDGEWRITALDTFPNAWLRSYLDSLENNGDPIFREATSTCMPVKWSRQHFRKRRLFYRAAFRAGLCHGITFPFRGPNGALSLFSVARHRNPIGDDEMISLSMTLFPILAAAHDVFVAQMKTDLPLSSAAKLTSRERQVLIQASEGQTSVEIARKLMVTERTVNFHIENVLRKLKVKTRAHAIARANAIGIIQC